MCRDTIHMNVEGIIPVPIMPPMLRMLSRTTPVFNMIVLVSAPGLGFASSPKIRRNGP